MNNDIKREKKILEYLQSIQHRQNYSEDFWHIAKAIDEDLKQVKISCSDLNQKKYIRYIKHGYGQHMELFAVITTSGKEALKTKYDSDWRSKQEQDKKEEKEL